MLTYAYEGLIRQLKESKRKYLSGVSIQGTVQRLKARVLYAEAWIIGVHKRVDEFSGITEEVERAIHAYTQRNYPGVPVTKMKRRKLDMDAYRAYIQGKGTVKAFLCTNPCGVTSTGMLVSPSTRPCSNRRNPFRTKIGTHQDLAWVLAGVRLRVGIAARSGCR